VNSPAAAMLERSSHSSERTASLVHPPLHLANTYRVKLPHSHPRTSQNFLNEGLNQLLATQILLKTLENT